MENIKPHELAAAVLKQWEQIKDSDSSDMPSLCDLIAFAIEDSIAETMVKNADIAQLEASLKNAKDAHTRMFEQCRKWRKRALLVQKIRVYELFDEEHASSKMVSEYEALIKQLNDSFEQPNSITES